MSKIPKSTFHFTLLKWKLPLDAKEAQERFVLLEDRGDRLLVGNAAGLRNGASLIDRAQFVYARADLIDVEESGVCSSCGVQLPLSELKASMDSPLHASFTCKPCLGKVSE